ncbi:MAG: phosphate ABC transporter substrate-binding protein [Syntrophales bacterium]|jgi:phosphate transport system substrate-binding protein|nr:phosphate ABC transporter substrate-binding protein [Syntrophales bacterium]MDY0044220.1 phosphate ABC transporter substrate-binding protein [Syntrophales bacterium]
MKTTTKMIVIGFILLFVCVFGTSALSETKTIVIKGSTTVLPVAQAAAEAYMAEHKDVNISISGGGSGNGIKALIDKSTDIATSSRFIKDKEVKMAVEKGAYPVSHRVAIDAIVPIVHPENPVKDLTIEQLSLIYQGKITNWKDVGGNDKKIVVVSRDTSSGTYEVWEELVLHKAKVTPRAQLQASNGAVHQTISKNSYAIGYIGFGYLNKEVKAVNVNGVVPSMDAALSGAYPVARPLFMFTAGWPSGVTMDFINFLLSPKGQEVVKKEGFIPLY